MSFWTLNQGIIASSSSGFVPSDLGSDLQAWYDGSDAATITDAGSGKVSAWNDKSGNSRHLLQGTGANRPTWDGVNTITANGTSEYLTNSSPFMYANGSIMVSGVFKSNAPTAGRSLFGEGRTSNSTPIYQTMHNFASGLENNDVYGYIRNDANSVLLANTLGFGTTFFDDNWHVFNWIDTGSQITVVVDGVAGTTPRAYTRSGAMTLNTFSLFALVRTTIGNYMPGSGREFVISNILNDAKINKLNAYLADHNGV